MRLPSGLLPMSAERRLRCRALARWLEPRPYRTSSSSLRVPQNMHSMRQYSQWHSFHWLPPRNGPLNMSALASAVLCSTPLTLRRLSVYPSSSPPPCQWRWPHACGADLRVLAPLERFPGPVPDPLGNTVSEALSLRWRCRIQASGRDSCCCSTPRACTPLSATQSSHKSPCEVSQSMGPALSGTPPSFGAFMLFRAEA